MSDASTTTAGRPVVVYVHRYPIEDESEQFPATQRLIQLLSVRCDVVYFSMSGPRRNEALRQNCRFEVIPLSVNWVNTRDKWTKTLLYYAYLPLALRRLRRLNPDLIICKETLPLAPSLIVRLRRPTLIDIGDWWLSIMFGKSGFGRKLAAWVERMEVTDWNKFNVVAVTHTKAEINSVVGRGMDRDRIHVISAAQHEGVYMPLDGQAERQRLGFTGDDWVTAVHGIIHPSKGYDQILEWWADIIKTRPNWKLLIIGGSGEENRCRQIRTALGLERHVAMTGWLASHAAVNLALNAADCLLVTRRNTAENQGVIPSSLFHNLVLGKPTVVTGLPGMCEVVQDRINGFIFEPDNPASFRATLEFVCDHREQAAKIASRGAQTAEESFDVNLCAQKYVDLILNALQR